MAIKYPYRMTHTPSGFSAVIALDNADWVSLADKNHVPLQGKLSDRLYEAVTSRTIKASFTTFLWGDIVTIALTPYSDEDDLPPAA